MGHGGARDRSHQPLGPTGRSEAGGIEGDLVQGTDGTDAGSLIHSGRPILRQVQGSADGARDASMERLVLNRGVGMRDNHWGPLRAFRPTY